MSFITANLSLFYCNTMIAQFIKPAAKDIVDIVVIWFILYNMIILAKRIGGYQILIGLALLALFFVAAAYLQLEMVLAVTGIITDYWILLLAILFQQEIRSVLAKISNTNLMDAFRRSPKQSAYAPLINAVDTMAFMKKGAIIVLENKIKLNKYINTGERIDANLSGKLITSIFDKGSVLHDGAVILRKDRIVAAKVVLPLSQNVEYRRQFGTRHLAAIGITDETDALAIVVSEETGLISVAKAGVIETDINTQELTRYIMENVQ